MKKILLMSAAAAAMILASCTKENGGEKHVSDSDVAYLSIKVDSQRGTRASSENDGSNESDLNKLYLITFNSAGDVMAVPGDTKFYSLIDPTKQTGTNTSNKPGAVKIAATSKNLVVIANPGAALEKAITDLGPGSTFESLNAAIAGVTTSDINSANGFAMITAGDEANPVSGNKVVYPYVDIEDKTQASAADAEQDPNRVPVKLERLAAKLVVNAAATITAPKNAKVTLKKWVADGLNTTYYPFAEKTLLSDNHSGVGTNTPVYTKDFYTKDPNFFSDPDLGYSKGLEYTKIDPVTFAQTLPFGGSWKNKDEIDYVIENTMDAANQKIGSATRIIMEATYFPVFDASSGFTYTDGEDWFSWAGKDYPSLGALQQAYGEANATTSLKEACDAFYDKITAFKSGISAMGFADLKPEDLTSITEGGQVVKDDKNPVIRWYKEGRCYYSYEIRHDNEITENMVLGRYGVVRNNWYNLTLKSVRGPGTPWYPEATKPGPGDPDPKDPIDTKEGYLGVYVTINPWFFWTTDMNDID